MAVQLVANLVVTARLFWLWRENEAKLFKTSVLNIPVSLTVSVISKSDEASVKKEYFQ